MLRTKPVPVFALRVSIRRMAVADTARLEVRDWPRLMSEPTAAQYLSIGVSTLRAAGPQPKRLGRRVLYDIRDLDRWADGLDGQPLDERAQLEEAAEVERRFLERRRGAH